MTNSRMIFWLFFLAFLWGPSFVFIKIAVQEIPPLTLVVLRVGFAAVILYTILRLKGLRLPTDKKMWRHFSILGLFAHALPFFLFNWGETHIDSALASILNGTTPLFTMIFAHFWIADERLTPQKIFGALVGFLGLFILTSPSLLHGFESTTLGIIAVAFAAVSYGIAIVYARRNLRGLKPLVAPTAQLTMATVIMIPVSFLVDKPWQLVAPSLAATGSVLALAAFGTALAFVIYYFILDHAGATYLSTVTYLVPVFGVALGVSILNEKLSWHAYAGCAAILVGVMIANGVIKLPFGFLNRRVAAGEVG